MKKLLDAVITGAWCFIWAIPVFCLYFIASILTPLIIKYKPKFKYNEHDTN